MKILIVEDDKNIREGESRTSSLVIIRLKHLMDREKLSQNLGESKISAL